MLKMSWWKFEHHLTEKVSLKFIKVKKKKNPLKKRLQVCLKICFKMNFIETQSNEWQSRSFRITTDIIVIITVLIKDMSYTCGNEMIPQNNIWDDFYFVFLFFNTQKVRKWNCANWWRWNTKCMTGELPIVLRWNIIATWSFCLD